MSSLPQVPTVADGRAHLLRWWMVQTAGLVIGVTTVIGLSIEGIGLLWVARARPEWLQLALGLLVVTTGIGLLGIGVQIVLALRLPREKGITARHPWPQRLAILTVAAVLMAAVFLGAPMIPAVAYPSMMTAAFLGAMAVDRALDEGWIDVAERRALVVRWLLLFRGVGGRIVVERGDRDAVVTTREQAERDPGLGGRTVWLQHHVLAVLEHEPERAIEVARAHVAARPMEVESHALLALCQLERSAPDEQTVPRLELSLQSARRLVSSLRHPHRTAILAATLAWAHAVEGRHDLAREQVERGAVPAAPVPAAEVGWRQGRALLACGDVEAARERFARYAGTVGWAGRRCAAELDRLAQEET